VAAAPPFPVFPSNVVSNSLLVCPFVLQAGLQRVSFRFTFFWAREERGLPAHSLIFWPWGLNQVRSPFPAGAFHKLFSPLLLASLTILSWTLVPTVILPRFFLGGRRFFCFFNRPHLCFFPSKSRFEHSCFSVPPSSCRRIIFFVFTLPSFSSYEEVLV